MLRETIYGLMLSVLSAVAVASKTPSGTTTLVASSSFQLELQPTFTKLTSEDYLAVSVAISEVVLSTALAKGEDRLQSVDVLLQDAEWNGSERRQLAPEPLKLPSTTITFAVLGTFTTSPSTKVYLDQLIVETFSRPRADFFESLSSVPALKDLVDATVVPISVSRTPSSSLKKMTVVDIVLVAMAGLVLLALGVLVYRTRKMNRIAFLEQQANHRELSPGSSQLWNQVWMNENDDTNSMYKLKASGRSSMDMFSILKSTNATNCTMSVTPKATEEEDSEPAMSEQALSESGEAGYFMTPDTSQKGSVSLSSQSSSSQSSGSSKQELSQEGLSHLLSSEVSSSNSDNSDLEEVSLNENDSNSYASSGISSAQFSSRWFQRTMLSSAMSEMSETSDVFGVDIASAQDRDENTSKATATTVSMLEWTRTLKVIPSVSDGPSVATPDADGMNTYVTPCSGSTSDDSSGVVHP